MVGSERSVLKHLGEISQLSDFGQKQEDEFFINVCGDPNHGDLVGLVETNLELRGMKVPEMA